ncbi:MAG: ferritin-like domain-containing protein [Anaerovoracaceae bacterium]
MNKKVAELLNDQINKEFYSAYLYLEFANYYDSIGLDGFENWYRIQAQEERTTPCCSRISAQQRYKGRI